MVAIAAIVVLTIGAAAYFYRQAGTDPAVIRSTIAVAGKSACFADARADPRNVLRPDAKLRAFCTCTLATAVAAMSDADARQAAVNTMAMTSTMKGGLATANRTCKAELE